MGEAQNIIERLLDKTNLEKISADKMFLRNEITEKEYDFLLKIIDNREQSIRKIRKEVTKK